MVPYYVTKTLLFCNKTTLQGGGHRQAAGELRRHPRRRRQDQGRREDRAADAQLRLAVLAADADERRRPADARPQEGDLQHAQGGRGHRPGWPRRPRAAPSTRSRGPAAGSSPTTPSPPAMSACYTPIRRPSSGSRARDRGSTATRWASRTCRATARRPTRHGLGISKGSKNPDLAWDFVKFLTDSEVATRSPRIASSLTGNVAVDKAQLARSRRTIRSSSRC